MQSNLQQFLWKEIDIFKILFTYKFNSACFSASKYEIIYICMKSVQ